MQRTHIKNCTIISEDAIVKNSSLTINNKTIASIGKSAILRKGDFIIDAKDCYISPGFIDTHIHGAAEDIFSYETKFGTTAMVVALSCDRLTNIYSAVDRIHKFKKNSCLGKNILGVRLEGPYISKEKAGAQKLSCIRKPNIKELYTILKRCGSLLKIMTIAPEEKGAIELVKILRKAGVVASIGHSNAYTKEARSGIDAGIKHATHMFNAMSGKEHLDGVVGAVLKGRRIICEVILDLVHVSKKRAKFLLKQKGLRGIILITDSIRARHPRGAKKDGVVYRLADERLAGSCLTMVGAVKNAVKRLGLSLPDAVRLASLNPARLLSVEDKKGSIEVGKDADLVIFDKNFNVKVTIINGKIVYKKGLTICAG